MRAKHCRRESGVALLLSILALLLLSAIAVSMMYMSSTEASVNGNFKTEETQYFAARAGLEEIRDRMIPSTAPYSINGIDGINPNAPNPQCPGEANCYLPTELPGPANNGSVVYLLQSGMTTSQIFTPVVNGAPNPLFDDELCHDYAGYGQMQTAAPNVRCTTLPGGNGQAWYSIPALANGANVAAPGLAANSPGVSFAPTWQNGASSNPLEWKWARITLKANNSNPNYPVDGNNANATLACYNGTSEVPLPAALAGTLTASGAPIACQQMTPIATPVYLVTALAVSNTGARRLIQSEMAQVPLIPAPGLFATGQGCAGPPFQIGGGATTYSYDGNTNPNPTPATASLSGNIGSNGAIAVQGTSTTVNGSISSLLPPGVNAGCPATSTSVSGNGQIWDPVKGAYVTLSSLTTAQAQADGLMPQLPVAYNPPVPPIPNKVPTTSCTAQNGCLSPVQTCTQTCNKVKGKLVCTTTCVNSGYTLAPGSYGDISLTGGAQLTLTGGTYNINSISVAGNSNITIAGTTTINVAGQSDANFNPLGGAVVDFTGGSLTNSSSNPANLTINYGGSGTVILNGGGGLYAVLNAPNAALTLKGGGNFYGQAVAQTIDDRGGTNFYFDSTLNNDVNDSPFIEISMRELSY